MAGAVQGYHHDARGIEVQTVDHAGLGVVLLQPADQAVAVEGMPPRHAEEQVRLAHQQQVGVGVQDTNRLLAVGHQVRGQLVFAAHIFSRPPCPVRADRRQW